MLDPRTEHILAAVIKEFIETGEPVSSGLLYSNYNFGIKPAMIRLVLKELDEAGYLEQPNYSAGRVPSDRGYQFFAEYTLENAPAAAEPRRELSHALRREAWKDFLHELSSELGVVSAAAVPSEDNIYKTGLEELIDRLEWQSHAELKAVVHDIEALDERVAEARDELSALPGIKIFIGRKSPVTRCDALSVVASDYDVGGEQVLLLAIGPKRMNYQKAARVFQNLKHATA